MSKKNLHRIAVQKGIEQLRQVGVETENLSSAAVGSISAHLGKGRETDLAAIFLLGRIADPTALEALASVERKTTDREIRKEIRRSLFKLAQRGMTVPQAETREKSAPRPFVKVGPEIEGYLSSVDGTGGRLVWLARPQIGSGLQWLQAMVSDREGLMQVGGAMVRRKDLRRMGQEIKENHGVTMITIPWEYGDQILYEGFEKAKGVGRSEVESFPSLRSLFTQSKPKPVPHPVYDRLSSEGVRSGAWRDLSRRLLDEPEFHPWVLDEDWVQPYLEQMTEAQESRLVLNPLQKEARLAGIVRVAVRDFFSGEKAKLFQRRMEDMALYLGETKREEQAKLALALALQLREEDLGGLDISFFSVLIQKSLAFYTSQTKAETEEPSLIVKP
ncbi:MAG: hypothetical protein ACE5HC_12275 [Candidatus Binatia bacterium]